MNRNVDVQTAVTPVMRPMIDTGPIGGDIYRARAIGNMLQDSAASENLPMSFVRWPQTDTHFAEQEVEKKFRVLAEEWIRDTQIESSISRIAMHPAYQNIIGMGKGAIRLILRDLQQRPHHWFWALRAITGESPISPEAQGNIHLMTQAWLEWGRLKGYLA